MARYINLMSSSGSGLSVSAGSGVTTNNNQVIYYNGTDQDPIKWSGAAAGGWTSI
jgi:hypothetical protein